MNPSSEVTYCCLYSDLHSRYTLHSGLYTAMHTDSVGCSAMYYSISCSNPVMNTPKFFSLPNCNHTLVRTNVELHANSGCGFIRSRWLISTPAHLHRGVGGPAERVQEPATDCTQRRPSRYMCVGGRRVVCKHVCG